MAEDSLLNSFRACGANYALSRFVCQPLLSLFVASALVLLKLGTRRFWTLLRKRLASGDSKQFGTQSKRRIIPLTPRVQPLIEGHLALHDEFGMSARTIQRLITRAAISRKVSPHVLRHTFSVTAILKGISLPSLQRLLGHDRLTTTEIYLNISPEEVIKEFQSKW